MSPILFANWTHSPPKNHNVSDLLHPLHLGLSSDAAAVLSTRKKIDVLDSHMSYLDTGNVAGSDNTGENDLHLWNVLVGIINYLVLHI